MQTANTPTIWVVEPEDGGFWVKRIVYPKSKFLFKEGKPFLAIYDDGENPEIFAEAEKIAKEKNVFPKNDLLDI